jgi:hypothetical protein
MTSRKEKRLLARAGLVLWGFFTLVLLFSVVLLCMQLVELGSNPLAFATQPPAAPPAPAPAKSADTAKAQDVTLYFGAPSSVMLQAERRSVPLPGTTTENCKAVLAELIKGSTTGLAPILPPSTKVRSAFLMNDGELVVDLTVDALDAARSSASDEALLVYGLANTLAQSELAGDKKAIVRKVRVLIEGEAYTGHIDVSAAYIPDSSWVAAPEKPKG